MPSATGAPRKVVRDGSGDNPKLDPAASCPTDAKFSDAESLKKLMVADLNKFASAFSRKNSPPTPCAAAMTFADRRALENISEEAKTHDYDLDNIIETLGHPTRSSNAADTGNSK